MRGVDDPADYKSANEKRAQSPIFREYFNSIICNNILIVNIL